MIILISFCWFIFRTNCFHWNILEKKKCFDGNVIDLRFYENVLQHIILRYTRYVYLVCNFFRHVTLSYPLYIILNHFSWNQILFEIVNYLPFSTNTMCLYYAICHMNNIILAHYS